MQAISWATKVMDALRWENLFPSRTLDLFLVRLRLIQLSIVISVKIITRVASNISYLCVYLVFISLLIVFDFLPLSQEEQNEVQVDQELQRLW